MGSGVVAHRLSCPVPCGILVPGPGIEPTSSALAGGFLTRVKTTRVVPGYAFSFKTSVMGLNVGKV